jgi:membrane-bound lytic murein transglycosylase D
MSEPELRSLNKIPPRMLVRAGSTLLVPRANGQGTEVPEHLADNGHLQLQPEVVLVRRSVKARKGENLTSMASRLGVNASELAQWNKLGSNAALKAGQTLVAFTPTVEARGASSSSRTGTKTASIQAKPQRSGKTVGIEKPSKRTAGETKTTRKASPPAPKRVARK